MNARFCAPPAIRKSWSVEWAFLVVAVLLWIALTALRSRLIVPFCGTQLALCRVENLNWLDRMYVGTYHSQIDFLSFATQYCAGVVAFFVPLWIAKKSGKWDAFKVDAMVFLQTLVWNGLVTEVTHLLTGRPRPFVYLDPTQYGALVAHYTSMVSGHTSFATASSVALILALYGHRRSEKAIRLAYCSGVFWILTTAAFRVLAGRHFITDTLGAMVTGTAVAAAVAFLHRASAQSQTRAA